MCSYWMLPYYRERHWRGLLMNSTSASSSVDSDWWMSLLAGGVFCRDSRWYLGWLELSQLSQESLVFELVAELALSFLKPPLPSRERYWSWAQDESCVVLPAEASVPSLVSAASCWIYILQLPLDSSTVRGAWGLLAQPLHLLGSLRQSAWKRGWYSHSWGYPEVYNILRRRYLRCFFRYFGLFVHFFYWSSWGTSISYLRLPLIHLYNAGRDLHKPKGSST